ncbi:XdhC family protein [Chelativorans sp. SCAU2101]|jgi:Xanthine and CO dehydrogenases maturation factor, XdhC/CoxF family|uniref:XdhC family protein n=1 Tax=Chelativorans petroleitrophicus TaxID=2975484 RepID=A0A9X3B6Y5_9HYPH|nr:XdhC family protein [Chelativorans petroleitrophicus]MCT8990998.1 XdhC family protein [Chelativorans petroleitrophicus]
MDPYSLKKLNQCRRERRAAILLTDLGDGRDRVVVEGDLVAGNLGEAVASAFRSGKSGVVEVDGRSFFLNVHLPPPRLVMIGAVHISQALAPMAAIAGFDLHIIDPRTAFASPERFPNVRLDAEWPQEALARSPLDAYCALAALTHDPKIDDPALKAALEAGCFYVGALGSRKTHARRVERLTEAGVSPAAIERIRAPIGLKIGAASPAEIAVAVLAEIIEALRSRGLSASRSVAA